jgi:cell division FtsZ-interacting protein ZapD
MLSNGEIDKEEFDALIADQRLAAEQFVHTQAIGAQVRQQRLTLQLLDLTVTKLAPALLAAL